MKDERLLERIRVKRQNVRFDDFVRLVKAMGFEEDRQVGSHKIFVHKCGAVLNLQKEHGEAKPYQINMNTSNYTRKVFYSEEDRGWIAVAPEIQGCSAFGKTDAEALRELDAAIAAHLSVRRKHGFAIPKPISGQKLEGRILLRLPRALQRTLKEDALEEGVSVNQYALFLIATARAQRHAVQTQPS